MLLQIPKMTPQLLKKEFDAEIFGQHKAKEVLSFAFYLHLLRIQNAAQNTPSVLPKSNILLLGSSGSGKRLVVSVFCKNHNIPCVKIDSNLFLAGQNLSDVIDTYLRYLIQQVGLENAKNAIIVFEDFDKIALRQNGNNNMELQDDILAFIEQQEKILQVEQDKEAIVFPMQNLMFVFSGKFSGLDSLVYMRNRMSNKQDAIIQKKEERLKLVEKYRALRFAEMDAENKKQLTGIGFANASKQKAQTAKPDADIKVAIDKLYNQLKEDELENLVEANFNKEMMQQMELELEKDASIIEKVQYEDLLNYGMLPELISRIGFIAPFDRLNKDEIVQILKRPNGNIINQYKQYFAATGNTLDLQEAVLDLIAQEVAHRNVGTRSINTVMLQLLEEYLFIAPSKTKQKFVIDAAYFNKKIGAVV